MIESLDRAAAAGVAHDVSSLRQIVSSGEMWSDESKRALLSHRDLTLFDTLGSSEGMGFASNVTRRGDDTTTARFRLGEDATVLTDDGRAVEPGSGEVGMLAVGGPIPLGYYKDDAKTAETFREVGGRRWSVPGDFATIERDGSITLLGRGSVSINSGGEKIFPEEVEEALKSHPAVRDSTVVGLADERWGQAVTALVAMAPGAVVSDEELSAHVRERIAHYKAPKKILRIGEIRRGPNGKADYRWASATAEELAAGT
ncbi:MAG: acyl-CoA synthetase, partial [Acidimicrobiales bacterium]